MILRHVWQRMLGHHQPNHEAVQFLQPHVRQADLVGDDCGVQVLALKQAFQNLFGVISLEPLAKGLEHFAQRLGHRRRRRVDQDVILIEQTV